MSDRNDKSLIARGLHKQYGSRMVVNNVDISVNRNEVVGLLGPNGAGKTTTFYMITGMIKPTKGDIFLDDKKITLDPMYKSCLLYTSPSPRDVEESRMPSSA